MRIFHFNNPNFWFWGLAAMYSTSEISGLLHRRVWWMGKHIMSILYSVLYSKSYVVYLHNVAQMYITCVIWIKREKKLNCFSRTRTCERARTRLSNGLYVSEKDFSKPLKVTVVRKLPAFFVFVFQHVTFEKWLVGCRSNCQLVRPGTLGRMPSVGGLSKGS